MKVSYKEKVTRAYPNINFVIPDITETVKEPVMTGTISPGNGGMILLTVGVIGGKPAPDTFIWTLPDGTNLAAGDNTSVYSTSNAQVNLLSDVVT